MKIGDKTIAVCTEKVQTLLYEYQAELNKAYLHAEDALKVKLDLSITPDIRGNKIKAGIKFVVDEAKGTTDPAYADENQLALDLQEKVVPIFPRPVLQARPGAWSRGHGRWC